MNGSGERVGMRCGGCGQVGVSRGTFDGEGGKLERVVGQGLALAVVEAEFGGVQHVDCHEAVISAREGVDVQHHPCW